MAYRVSTIISPKDAPRNLAVKDYVCDTAADISLLPRVGIEGTQVLGDGSDVYENEPCDYGSTATVAEPFSGYILPPSNEWKQVF